MREFFLELNKLLKSNPSLILASLILRLLLAPISFHPWELQTWICTANDLAAGLNPYTRFSELSSIVSARVVEGHGWALYYEYWAYPPLWLGFLWIAGMIGLPKIEPLIYAGYPSFPFSFWAGFLFKLPLIAADILAGWVLFKLAELLRIPHPTQMLKLWLLNPLGIFITGIWGHFDIIPVLLSICSIYLGLRGKLWSSAFSLGLAAASKSYPILILPVMLIWMGKLSSSLIYLGIFSLTLGSICAPFLLWDPESFLEANLHFHAERLGGGMTYWSIVWILAEWLGLSKLWWGIPISNSYFAIMAFGLVLIYAKLLKSGISSGWLPYAAAIPILAFLSTSKLVNEPYALWALPCMILAFRAGLLDEWIYRAYYAIPIGFAIIGVPITNFLRWLGGFELGLKLMGYFGMPIPLRVIPLFILGCGFSAICAISAYQLCSKLLRSQASS